MSQGRETLLAPLAETASSKVRGSETSYKTLLDLWSQPIELGTVYSGQSGQDRLSRFSEGVMFGLGEVATRVYALTRNRVNQVTNRISTRLQRV